VLFTLDDLTTTAILLAWTLVCLTLNGWLTAWLARRSGVYVAARQLPDPRRQLDPFGAVSAVIGGVGWSAPVELPRWSGSRVARIVLPGPALLVVAGLASLTVQARSTYDELGRAINEIGLSEFLRTEVGGALFTRGDEIWLLGGIVALMTGLLHLVPLPPLPGGQVLFASAPRTSGWQRAEYQLVERNIGLVIVLVLMILPLGGRNATILPYLLDAVFGPLVEALAGG
jgi:Zn-dependent protease